MKNEFVKYQHIEQFGSDEVEGIEDGAVYLFPKIDGTCSCVWRDDRSGLRFGSRNREVTVNEDNQGFAAWASENEELAEFFEEFPNLRLFGEWLVPHTVKGYRDDAWRRFYVFDVCDDFGLNMWYRPYEQYRPVLEEYGLDYIPIMAKCENATKEQFIAALDKNTFLMKDDAGAGEGVILKNYDFVNKFGKTKWAKLVRTEFKEKNWKAFGGPTIKGKRKIEEEIAIEYCTEALIKKEHAKVVAKNDGWNKRYIPEFIGRVWHAFVTENLWDIIKQRKNPTIDFKTLNRSVTRRIKHVMPEVF